MTEIVSIPASVPATISLTLGEIVLKSTIVMLLTMVACALLKRQSAAVRHRVLVFGLAAAIVVPTSSMIVPEMTLQVLPPARDGDGVVPARALESMYPIGATEVPEADATGGNAAGNGVTNPGSNGFSNRTTVTDAMTSEQPTGGLPQLFAGMSRIEQALVVGWLFGTIVGLALFLNALARQSTTLRRLRKVDDEDWTRSLSAAAASLKIRRSIVTLESDQACVPAVAGILESQLMVPSDWRTWTPTQRHCILLHELAHVKRRDVLTQLLGHLVLLAYWFNPLVWQAVRRLRVERELASDDCVLLAGQSASEYAEQLLQTLRCYRPARPVLGVAMAHSARLDQRVLAILDPQRRRDPVGARLAVLSFGVVGMLCVLLGGITLAAQAADPSVAPQATIPEEAAGPVWKENYTVQYPGTLPVSVEFSADGETLLTGDTAGEIMVLIFGGDEPQYRWKSDVGGSHAAVSFSADQTQVYATTEHGVRILDAADGREAARIEEQNSRPIAVGVFPEKSISADHTRAQIAFGTARGYFIKGWAKGHLPDTVGTIETSTVAQDAEPADEAAVPLAVDPLGRSAIMTGPRDATGEVSGVKGKNILWAYVCGDYDEGSPGNRVMVGHTATVVSAAWAKTGSVAVTGDADGRVIVWDAATMKETGRLELGGRVAALAISDDAQRIAAYVLGKQGRVFVWETADAPDNADAMQPIHTELADFNGSSSYASLSFSPDGGRLAGCAMNKAWLNRLGELIGKVRVWELADAPQAQLPPKLLYSKQLPKGSTSQFVIRDNHSIILPVANRQGAIDFRDTLDGGILLRLTLGEFEIGGMKLSPDRNWLAIEQHALIPTGSLTRPSMEFDVGVLQLSSMQQLLAIPACRRMLDIASQGKAVAVVREQGIELWDATTAKQLKSAPFECTRIDAAAFSPDGGLLAIIDRNDLVLWSWEQDEHKRMHLGRSVGSLAFSPDGRFLAEGPAPRENIQIRDVQTRAVVQSLSNGTKLSMNVPRLAFAQGGRVLIACDNITYKEGIDVPYRINLWDTATGAIAHQIAVPEGLPYNLGISPNGRHLIAVVDHGESGMTLNVWRLDGVTPVRATGPMPPAAEQSR